MNKILIDNATISSVQRALGKAPLKEPALLDIEHVSLARFCEAVLFNNNIVVPDNYKQELTPARKALLNNEVFSFEPLSSNEDNDILKISTSLLDTYKEAFHAGDNRSLFNKYFSQVEAFSNFIWEHSGSAFYLVFRANGINKENPLIEALLASPANKELGKEFQILGNDNLPVAWNKLSGHVKRMLSVMGWLSNQYIWHQVYAANHECTYMPHPLRDFFAYDFLNRINLGSKNNLEFAKVFSDGIKNFQGKLGDILTSLSQTESACNINLPGILPFLIRESSSGKDFLDVLFQVRNEPELIELRGLFDSVYDSINIGNYKPLSKIKREIEVVGENFLREKGFRERFISLSLPTTILGISITGEDAGIKLPIPSILYKQYFFTRRYRAFIKRVMEELAIPAQYGELKDKLNSYAWIKEERYPKFYLKQEHFPSKFHKKFDKSII